MRYLYLTTAAIALSVAAAGAFAQQGKMSNEGGGPSATPGMAQQNESNGMAGENTGAEKGQAAEENGRGMKKEKSRAAEEHGMKKENGRAAEERGMKKENGRAAEEHGMNKEKSRAAEEHGMRKGRANITAAQRSRIQTTVRNEHVQNITHVNFALNVGTVVPSGYSFLPLPADIVSFVPEYRGFNYLLAEDNVIIIDPATGAIVDIIPL